MKGERNGEGKYEAKGKALYYKYVLCKIVILKRVVALKHFCTEAPLHSYIGNITIESNSTEMSLEYKHGKPIWCNKKLSP